MRQADSIYLAYDQVSGAITAGIANNKIFTMTSTLYNGSIYSFLKGESKFINDTLDHAHST